MKQLLTGKYVFLTGLFFCLTACGGGGGNNSNSSNPAEPIPATVAISGSITFEKVPHTSASNAGLNYDASFAKAVRGIVVEAIDSNNTVLTNTVSDANGDYSLTVASNTSVTIRAKAQLQDNAWHVKVTDNTRSNALYAMDGEANSSGTSDSTRHLHAPSGWTGTSYGQIRVAAPFAILDVVYTGIQQIITNAPQTIFPSLDIRWSENNRSVGGNISQGDIGTSFFNRENNQPVIYILGDENGDTDEYDEDVIAHEWTHYLESELSRQDSIGGNHSGSSALDMRVAFSEGLGNAMSGIINGDSFYVDSFGSRQAVTAVAFNLETNNASRPGWYSESSVQTVLYDIADTSNENQDTLSLGIAGIMSTLTHERFKNHNALASIFSFAEVFKFVNPNTATGLDTILTSENINTSNAFAQGETNTAFRANHILPVYSDLTIGGSAINLCSINEFGTANKLSIYRFLSFTVTSTRDYTINLQQTSGPSPSDPDFLVFLKGSVVLNAQSAANNSESGTVNLSPAHYVLAITDFKNLNGNNSSGAISCFDISVI